MSWGISPCSSLSGVFGGGFGAIYIRTKIVWGAELYLLNFIGDRNFDDLGQIFIPAHILSGNQPSPDYWGLRLLGTLNDCMGLLLFFFF